MPSNSSSLLLASAENPANHEHAVKCLYSFENDTWELHRTKVVVAEKPFSCGGFRACFHMREVSEQSVGEKMVIKMIMSKRAHDSDYFSDAITQIVAQLYACKFNKLSGISRRVYFNPVSIMQLKERGGQFVVAEPHLDGKYVKHSDNNGYVNSRDELAPAFSHFTFEHSGCRLLVCDIQGVGDLYTDPQIHTHDGEGYGDGNLGRDGIVNFFRSHRCNGMCAALKLPQRKYNDADLFISRTHSARVPTVPWKAHRQCINNALAAMTRLDTLSSREKAPSSRKLQTKESPTRRESPTRALEKSMRLSSSPTIPKDVESPTRLLEKTMQLSSSPTVKRPLRRGQYATSFDEDDAIVMPDAFEGVYNVNK